LSTQPGQCLDTAGRVPLFRHERRVQHNRGDRLHDSSRKATRRPHTRACEQSCADGHVPAGRGRLASALDRYRNGVAHHFCDPECQPGGAPQPGRLIRRRLAGHSGEGGLHDHDIDVGRRVLAVDGTTRCHLIRPFSTA
jgi:hypothetical protein